MVKFTRGQRVHLIDDPQRTFIVHEQFGDRVVVIPDDTISEPNVLTFSVNQLSAN